MVSLRRDAAEHERGVRVSEAERVAVMVAPKVVGSLAVVWLHDQGVGPAVTQ